MSTENDGSGDSVWEDHFHPPRSNHARSESTRLPPRRPGDGLDYRRPVTLSHGENVVIDLTDEPDSPPRRSGLQFPQDLMNRTSPPADHPTVIDLEAEPTVDPVHSSPNSDDVQFLESISVRPRPIEPRFIDSNGIPMHYPPYTRSARGSGLGRSRREEEDIMLAGRRLYERLESMRGTILLGAPDYTQPSQPPPSSRRSSYKGLSPAPEGFTRLLAEDDVPVCPNCEEELGTGEGLKQQIHIAKPCGHVYCGECATNRAISKAKKAASKTKPFSKCQVAGCNKPVSSPAAMYHLYL
ncbi:Zinc finger, RING/FYVE/PHD-type [Penicillium griseofulvum]|uniref:Zinc finger, RING/FYVE/PHD-type n=1 Tax=Penicillium patulum TaxID=5078 RepID=A0A135LFN3_PENPA|nr:Zinc finger, RING/FYVE/PHD-type [Penicillium griseofulvum]KXG47710.1 Zinc finger, RING/FYVE/PHD-type [Penicillium griseofulvum]